MKLLVGRNFESGVPNHDMVIINEEAVRRLGFSSPEEAVGSKITFVSRWKGQPSTIIGVVGKVLSAISKGTANTIVAAI